MVQQFRKKPSRPSLKLSLLSVTLQTLTITAVLIHYFCWHCDVTYRADAVESQPSGLRGEWQMAPSQLRRKLPSGS